MNSSTVRTICRFCNYREAAVEAHIIPRSFFRARGVGKEDTYILSNKRKHASTTWTGIYDTQLVCAECEAGFNDLDRYGFKFFIRRSRCRCATRLASSWVGTIHPPILGSSNFSSWRFFGAHQHRRVMSSMR